VEAHSIKFIIGSLDCSKTYLSAWTMATVLSIVVLYLSKGFRPRLHPYSKFYLAAHANRVAQCCPIHPFSLTVSSGGLSLILQNLIPVVLWTTAAVVRDLLQVRIQPTLLLEGAHMGWLIGNRLH
jgi:hypothetical protein